VVFLNISCFTATSQPNNIITTPTIINLEVKVIDSHIDKFVTGDLVDQRKCEGMLYNCNVTLNDSSTVRRKSLMIQTLTQPSIH